MRKHILFLSGGLKIGGVERALIEYINNIDQQKYEITLFLMSDFGPDAVLESELKKSIKIKYIKSYEILKQKEELRKNKKNILEKIKYSFFLKKEKRIAEKMFIMYLKEISKPDIVIDFDRSFIKYKKYFTNIPSMIWIHASFSEMEKVKSIDIKKYRKILMNYDKIITVCNEMREEIVGLYPVFNKKIDVIYNPFNFDRIHAKSLEIDDLSGEEKELLKREYFLSVSRIDEKQKDFSTLIKAFKSIKNNGINEKLYIIGSGPDEIKLKELVKELELEKEILFLGAKKNPYIWMKNAKLYIHSSKYEGFGLILIEAMSLGAVVISSDCPVGPKEILGNGNSGILFKTGDEDNLTKTVMSILNNSEAIIKIKNNAKEHILKYDVNKVLNNFFNIVEEIIDNSKEKK